MQKTWLTPLNDVLATLVEKGPLLAYRCSSSNTFLLKCLILKKLKQSLLRSYFCVFAILDSFNDSLDAASNHLCHLMQRKMAKKLTETVKEGQSRTGS